jgi:hypothetical protein
VAKGSRRVECHIFTLNWSNGSWLPPDRSSNFSIQSSYFNLIYASQGAAEGQIAAYNCNDRNVASRNWHRLRSESVSCRSHAAISHRHSLLRFDQGHHFYLAGFLGLFPSAGGTMHVGVTSPTGMYILGSESPYGSLDQVKSAFGNVTGKQVS